MGVLIESVRSTRTHNKKTGYSYFPLQSELSLFERFTFQATGFTSGV